MSQMLLQLGLCVYERAVLQTSSIFVRFSLWSAGFSFAGIGILTRLERVEWEPSGGPDIPGGGVAIPGGHPEGADPIIESMAVYPATEDVRDVEDATIENVDESTAYGIPGLGNHLPTDLPDGYHFGKASLYETTMKNGTKYHLLRVTYTTSNDEIATAPDNDDGGVGVPAPNLFGSSFAVLIMDYEPRTNKPINSFEDLQEYLEAKDDNGAFHFAYKDVYIGFSPDDLLRKKFLMQLIPFHNMKSLRLINPVNNKLTIIIKLLLIFLNFCAIINPR